MTSFALLRRHRRHLLEWLGYGALMAAGAATLLALQHDELRRHEALEAARLQSLASVLAVNVQTGLDATNHALESVVADARTAARADAATRNAELTKLVAVMPGVRSMVVLDRDGIVVAADQADLPGRSLGTRAYFRLVRDHPQPHTLYVTAPFRSVRGDLAISLVRMVAGADGAFAGVAVATLDPEYFIAQFRAVHYAPDVRASVIHGDGIELLSYPGGGNLGGGNLDQPGTLFRRHRERAREASLQQGLDGAAGGPRLMALHTVQPAALGMDRAIVIGLSRDQAAVALPLHQHARHMWMLCGGAALAGALVLALAQRQRRLGQRLRDEREAERARIEALAGSERRFKTLIEDAPLAIAILRHGRFIYTNPRYRALHGYLPQDDLQGLPWRAMLAGQSRQALQREEALIEADSAHEQTFEALGLGKAGSLVPVLKATARVMLADGGATLVFAQDISAQKHAEAELTLARDAARAASRAKADFLANMSHEIRSPLNAVLGLAYLLERMRLDPEARDAVHKLRGAGQSLLGIVNDILDMSKIEAGHMVLEQAPFRLADVIDRVASGMQVAAADKPVEIVIDAAPAGVEIVLGDAVRLQQVLGNLTGNAIKFTASGQVALGVRLLDRADDNARLAFSVRDTGIGIDAALHGEIFAPFAQADGSITRRFGGTGLGLTICRQLVRLMGGELALDSTPGAGSEFSFVLNLPLGASDAVAVPPTGDAGGQLQGVRVLVVDDSEINREVMQRILREQGASSHQAINGQAALAWLTAHPADVDLVLMDIQMPVMDGIEATRRIHELPQLAGLPVVALTAGAFTSQQEAALAAGMTHFISKPFDVAPTVALIRQVARSGARPVAAGPAPAAAGATDEPAEAPVDTAQGIDLWGDRDTYYGALHRFARCYGGAAQAIATRAARGQVAGAVALAHQLAGVGASLALPPLCRQARHAEQHLEAGVHAAALPLLDSELRRVLHAITALGPPPAVAAAAATDTPAAGTAGAAPWLLQLLSDLPAADPAPLDTALTALHGQLPEADWLALRTQVAAFEFDAAGALAHTLLAAQASLST